VSLQPLSRLPRIAPAAALLLSPLLHADQIVNPGRASALSVELQRTELDPENCFKVRDLAFERGGVRFYLTDGYLIFSRPLEGRRVAAVFSALDTGDDAELILRPPLRSERAALAQAAGTPNLNSHFSMAVFLFSDNTAEELSRQVESGLVKRVPEQGLLLAGRSGETVRNLLTSFQTRLTGDLLAGEPASGIFFTTIASRENGNLDILFDPLSPEPLVAGAVSSDSGSLEFRTWTNFAPRSFTPRQSPARVENYRIEALLAPDLSLGVTTRATVVAGAEPVRGALTFELAPEMLISSAQIDGKPAEVFRRESLRANLIGRRANEPFLLVLPAPFEPGSRHEIEIRHEGKVIRQAGNDVFFVAARTNWYPVHNPQFTRFDITFRSPKAWQVVATGEQVEEKVEGDVRITRHVTESPVRLAGFNVGDYASVRVARGGFKVEVCANKALEPGLASRATSFVLVPPAWPTRQGVRRTVDIMTVPAPPPDPRTRLASLAQAIATDFEWMAGQFGQPPLKTLSVSPIPGSFGQGFPGLLYLSTAVYLAESDRPAPMRTGAQAIFFNEILHAHETAHQWWGNLVTSGSYRDDWLMEALANYTAWLVLEKKKGARALEDQLQFALTGLRTERDGKTMESFGPPTWGTRLQSSVHPDPWRAIIYEKGGWIMHMLRRRMGDPAFMKMLSALVARYSYKQVTTDEFRELAAEFSPKGLPDPHLENFFDNWVYGTGIPQLQLATSVRGKAPAIDLKVTLTQSGVGESFGVDVPIEIRFPGGVKPIVKWVRTGPDPVILTMRLRSAPAKVELAPGGGVLAIRK
jgi:hypothetical protein